MSNDLVDLRAKITCETDTALTALAHARRCTKAEVVRAVLHEWGTRQLHESTVTAALMRGKGHLRDVVG